MKSKFDDLVGYNNLQLKLVPKTTFVFKNIFTGEKIHSSIGRNGILGETSLRHLNFEGKMYHLTREGNRNCISVTETLCENVGILLFLQFQKYVLSKHCVL